MAMLEGHIIEQSYGHDVIFRAFSFQIPCPSLVLLTGPSGSGKTTFLQLLNLFIPFQGQLRFDGIDLHTLTPNQQLSFRQLKVGCVYQESGLIKNLTVEDHMKLVELIKGPIHSKVVRFAWESFKQDVNLHQQVKTLSRGQQQRLAILLACFGDSKLLLLDEPTTGLDYKQRQRIYKLLNELSQDRCVVMSTHANPKEGLAFTHHLNLPIQQPTGLLQFSPLKNPLPLTTSRGLFPFAWLWRLLRKQRKKEIFRWQFNFFQTITFTILGVFISLMFVLSKELLIITETMIGGRYQYVKESISLETELHSTMANDTIFSGLDFQFQVRSHYDEQYFEFLKPYHQFFLFKDGFFRPLKDIHLGLINQFEPVNRLPHLQWMVSLHEDEVILGIQPFHLKLIASMLNCFPVLDEVNEKLSVESLPIHFSMDVPQWTYQDEKIFFLRAVTMTDQPTWFHSMKDYAYVMYETNLRLPSKGIEEIYDTQPWRVGKTMMIMTEEHSFLVKTWQDNKLFQHYHLQRHPTLGWNVYRTNTPRQQKPYWIREKESFHFHSSWGYHYYPEHMLSGFAQPLFFHPREAIDPIYLDTLKQIKSPYDWLAVSKPDHVNHGFVLANPSDAIKLKTDAALDFLKDDEIYLSRGLADAWNVGVGESIHVAFPLYDGNLPIGMIGEYKHQTWLIKGVNDSLQRFIFQQPNWWEKWLIVHAYVPSQRLLPEAWVIEDDQRRLPELEVIKPYAAVVKSIKIIQDGVILGMVSVGIVIGLPSMILFYYYLRQSLVDDKKTMLLLIGYGAPQSMIQQWYGGKLTWLMLELVVPTFIIIIGFDFVIKTLISSSFFIDIPYRFPIESISILIGLFIAFYSTMIAFQHSIMDRLFKKIK
jgi:ABC-type lipoprotein export system ATPase subunit